MVRGNVQKLIFILILTIIINSVSNIFVLKDLYTLGIIIVSTILLMLIFDYKKNDKAKNISRFKTNIFLVSTFLALTQIFETIGGLDQSVTMESVANGFKPMIIGVYVYIIFINLAQSDVEEEVSVTENGFGDEDASENSEENSFENKKNEIKNKIKALNLTRRESEIFELLLLDLPNKEISDKLFIAEATVKKHVQNILKKADCGNRLELIEKFE